MFLWRGERTRRRSDLLRSETASPLPGSCCRAANRHIVTHGRSRPFHARSWKGAETPHHLSAFPEHSYLYPDHHRRWNTPIVVLPSHGLRGRRHRRKRSCPRRTSPEAGHWCPVEVDIDPRSRSRRPISVRAAADSAHRSLVVKLCRPHADVGDRVAGSMCAHAGRPRRVRAHWHAGSRPAGRATSTSRVAHSQAWLAGGTGKPLGDGSDPLAATRYCGNPAC